MKKLLSDKAFLIELVCFVFLQIFVDMYRVFFESSFQIFGISLPELVNILFLGFLTIVFFFKNLKKPKIFIPIGIYTALVLVYLAVHIVNVLNFKQNIFNGSELNWFKEVYFIVRTVLIPVYIFYYFICSCFTFKTFEKIISALSLVISTNIIVTNIFKISFICYASTLEKNSFITRNVFEWFYNPDTEYPIFMTSKGWFYMGNQIGLILFILFVFVIMQALKYGNISRYAIALMNGVAMTMVGTKVSVLGSCIILALGFVFAVVFGVLLKQFTFNLKHFISYIVIVAVVAVLTMYSPMFSVQESRNEAYNVTEEQKEATQSMIQNFEEKNKDKDKDKDKDKNETEVPDPDLEEFIEEFSAYVSKVPYMFGVEPQFLELFPIKENFDFWYKIITEGNNKQIDYRFMKSEIYNEALDKNDNKFMDKLFGIGYISGFPYSERDFVSQNVWFGYVGTLMFVGPYILLTIYGIYLALKKIKKCFVYQNAFFAVGILMPLAISFIAGHLFYGIFSITIFALVAVGFYKFQNERE